MPGPTENWMPEPTLDGVAQARAVKWIPERKLDAADEFLKIGGGGVTSDDGGHVDSVSKSVVGNCMGLVNGKPVDDYKEVSLQ